METQALDDLTPDDLPGVATHRARAKAELDRSPSRQGRPSPSRHRDIRLFFLSRTAATAS